jgi:hypothetical protein
MQPELPLLVILASLVPRVGSEETHLRRMKERPLGAAALGRTGEDLGR